MMIDINQPIAFIVLNVIQRNLLWINEPLTQCLEIDEGDCDCFMLQIDTSYVYLNNSLLSTVRKPLHHVSSCFILFSYHNFTVTSCSGG